MDANHAAKMEKRRSHYDNIFYVNNAHIICYSKHHNAAEASVFGSDYFALMIASKMIESLWYNLRFLGGASRWRWRGIFVTTSKLSRTKVYLHQL